MDQHGLNEIPCNLETENVLDLIRRLREKCNGKSSDQHVNELNESVKAVSQENQTLLADIEKRSATIKELRMELDSLQAADQKAHSMKENIENGKCLTALMFYTILSTLECINFYTKVK